MWYGNSALYKIISTIVTPASTFDLTTVSAVETELNVAAGSIDAWAQRVITACSAAISNYCNRVFALQTYQDNFFPQRDPPISVLIGGVDPLQLVQYPINAGSSSVTEDGVALILGTDYLEDPELGQLTRLDVKGYPMRWPKLQIIAQYQAGFATIPADVADACIEFVKFRYYARTRDPSLRNIEIPGDFSASYVYNTGPGGPEDIPATVSAKVDRYRTPVVG